MLRLPSFSLYPLRTFTGSLPLSVLQLPIIDLAYRLGTPLRSTTTMSEETFPDYDSDEIDLTNRDLVSLFLQYPDMPDDDNESAAASDFGEDADTSTLSDTTTRTTPLRNDPVALLGSRALSEFSAFTQRLNESNLPQKATDYFRSLGNMILQIGRLLFPPISNTSVTKQDLREASNLCRQMASLLESSCQRVTEQIDNVAYILTLAPFTVRPAPEDLWANYKQMAELIIEWVLASQNDDSTDQ